MGFGSSDGSLPVPSTGLSPPWLNMSISSNRLEEDDRSNTELLSSIETLSGVDPMLAFVNMDFSDDEVDRLLPEAPVVGSKRWSNVQFSLELNWKGDCDECWANIGGCACWGDSVDGVICAGDAETGVSVLPAEG